jgi:hypothetical protein
VATKSPFERTDSRDEILKAKLPGGGGRVKGGTEARAFKRATRSILDATDAAIPSKGGFIALSRRQAEWLAILRSVIEKSEIGQSMIGEFSNLPAYADFLASVCGRRAG